MKITLTILLSLIGFERASAYSNEGKRLFLQAQFSESFHVLSRTKPSQFLSEQEIYYWQGRSLGSAGKRDSAVLIFSKAQPSTNADANEWYWRCQLRVAMAGLQTKQFNQAEKIFDAYLQSHSVRQSSYYHQAKFYYHYQKADFEKATVESINALKIAEAEKDTLGIIAYNIDIGNTYLLSNAKTKINYYQRSLDLQEKANIKTYHFATLNCLVAWHQGRHELEAAQVIIEKQIAYAQRLRNDFDLSYALFSKGVNEINLKKYQKALASIKKAHTIFVRLNNTTLANNCNLIEGEALVGLKKNQEAIEKLQAFLKNKSEVDNLAYEISAIKSLREANSNIGNYKVALDFAEQEQILKDSANNNEKIANIELLNAKYEAEKNELRIIQQELELIKKEKKLQSILIGAGLMIFMAIIFLMALVYNRNQVQRQTLATFRSIKVDINTLHQNLLNDNFDDNDFAVVNKFDDVIETRGVRELKREIQNVKTDFVRIFSQIKSFNATVSHELKSPIIHMQHTLDKLERQQGPHHEIDHLRKKLIDMAELINTLLSLAMIEEAVLNPNVVDLNTLLDDILASMEKPEKTQISYKNLPNIKVDVYFFRLAFINLLQNAIKFSADQEVPMIEISSIKEGRHVYIRVKDNGIGFENTQISKLFKQFSRLENARNKPGFGLGLVLVKKIIDMHNGEINIVSEPNIGTVVEIKLRPSL